MVNIFEYIISLGASVMMPIIFSILGLVLGVKPGKAILSGLYVGVGFVGLSIITKLLTGSLGPGLGQVVDIYNLRLGVFDMGWPAAAAVAYNTAVGAMIIPVCLGVNVILLLLRCTKTINIDLWNYWHFAFIGAMVYFASEGNLYWGFGSAIVCYILTLVMADRTAKKFQDYYEGMNGISVPQPFCQGMVPFAVIINGLLDRIPVFDRLTIDAEGMKKKFGLLGEPLFLGVIIGCSVGVLAEFNFENWEKSSSLMEALPRILGLGIWWHHHMYSINNKTKSTKLFLSVITSMSYDTFSFIYTSF